MKAKSLSRLLLVISFVVLLGALTRPSHAKTLSISPATCPPRNCVAGRNVGRDFFEGVIQRLSDVPMSDFAVDALAAWEPYENTLACWNPLATTRYKQGCCDFNSVHVRHYLNQPMGMDATAETLALGYYVHIRSMLRLENFDREGLRHDLSTWGSCRGAGCDSLLNTWQDMWNDAHTGSGSKVFVVDEPDITPAYKGMCGSAWYRFTNNLGHYAYLTLNTDKTAYSTNAATWTPNLPQTGVYKVEAYIAHHGPINWQCPSRHISWDTSDARYTIYHAGGKTSVSKNQGPVDNQWLDLGTFTFNAGRSGKVILTDLNGEAHLSHTVSFSAMRFTLVNSNPPPSSDDVIVGEPGIHPGYNGMCGSAWYRFRNNHGNYAYLTLNTPYPSQSTNWSTWRPHLPKTGLYNVQAYIPHHNSIDWQCPSKHIGWDTSDARYVIHHADGETTVARSQKTLDNQWLDLGTYTFQSGSDGWVKLTDLNGEPNLSHTISFSSMKFSYREDATYPWGRIIHPNGVPTWNESKAPFTLEASAEDNPGGSGVKHVHFWVRYADSPTSRSTWHDAGDDLSAPYRVNWTPPSTLRSQLVEIGIHVEDRAGNYCINPDPSNKFQCRVAESKQLAIYNQMNVLENWIPDHVRAYLNQLSLTVPDRRKRCGAASAAMMLAMNGKIGSDYNSMAKVAKELPAAATAKTYVERLNRDYSLGVVEKTYYFFWEKDAFWDDVVSSIIAKKPVMLLTTQFTTAGHYVVIIGYRKKNGIREFIVYDPFGRWKGAPNEYDQNSSVISGDDDTSRYSVKGRWVWYKLDDLWPSLGEFRYNKPYLILSDSVKNELASVSMAEQSPDSPPDMISEEDNADTIYEGVEIGCGISPTSDYSEVHGSVTIDGASAPADTFIEALNPRGDVVGCFEVTDSGEYGPMRIYGEANQTEPSTPGMRPGETVTFRVNGQPAVTLPPFVWQNDHLTHTIDLVVGGQDQVIQLHQNWTLMSFNRITPSAAVTEVLASAEGSYDRILGEEGSYVTTLPAQFNTLQEMEPGKAYWVHATSPVTLTLTGSPMPVNTPIELHTGWNWVGYLPEASQSVTQALTSIEGKYTWVIGDDGSFVPSLPVTFNTLKTMKPGKGYLIYMTEAATLTYPGPAVVQRASLPHPLSDVALCPDLARTPWFSEIYGQVDPAAAGRVLRALNGEGRVVGCAQVRADGSYGLMRLYGGKEADDPATPGLLPGEEAQFALGEQALSGVSVAWQPDYDAQRLDIPMPPVDLPNKLFLPSVQGSH